MFGFDDVLAGVEAAAPIVGGLLGFSGQQSANDANIRIASQASAFNAEQARENRDWQERMSNTSYQRAVKDLTAAGLNPMLAYGNGGASSPGGATGSAVVSKVENAPASGVASAQAAMNMAVAKAQVKQIEAQTENTQADTAVKLSQPSLQAAQTQQSLASAGHADAMRDQIRQDMTAFDDRMSKLRYETRSEMYRSDVGHYESQRASAGWKYIPENVANEAAMLASNAKLLGLEIPRSVNEAAAQSSWWKRKVSPYLPDFAKSASSALWLSKIK